MKTKIIEKDFWDIFHDNSLNILEFCWKNIGRDIEEEDFKNYLLEAVALLNTYKAEAFLIDARAYHAVVSPAMQEWNNAYIIPEYLKAGISMMVFVLGVDSDLLIPLSLEQSFDEDQNNASKMPTYFVDSLEKAKKLLQNRRLVGK